MAALRMWTGGVALGVILCCGALCQSNGFTIAGTVVQETTHQPVNRVLVTIEPTQHPEQSLSVVTAGDGRFSFSGLPAGKYSLSTQVGSSPATAFHQDGQYSTAIVTGPNLDTEHIVFAAAQFSSISGTVNDEEGEPVRGAQVHLFRRGVFNGRNRVVSLGQTSTNAVGEFYWGHLQPGIYLIGVAARPWYAQNYPPPSPHGSSLNADQATAPSDLDVAYPVTYSGGATDPDSATSIQISPGSPGSVQILLRPVPAARVHVASSAQQPPNVSLAAVGPGDLSIPVNSGMFSSTPSERTLVGIAPGKYWMTAQRFSPGRFRVGGRQEVEITGDSTLNLDDVPKAAISGKLTFEDPDPPKGRQAVVILSDGVNGQHTTFLQVGADGSLAANGVAEPGKYDLRLANAPGYYLKSVAVKGGSYSGGVLQIPENGAIQLSLVAAKGLSDIEGIALRNDQPFAGAMVLLIPENSNAAFIPRDQSDTDGTFTLRGVPPGKYRLVAIDDGRDLAYADSGVIQPYLPAGQTVLVPVQNEAKLKVSVQARQR